MPDQTNERGGDMAGKHYAVTSNVPVEINNPQRKARLIAAVYVVALVMCTIAGAYVACVFAIDQNDDAKRQLRAELEEQSKERDVQADSFQKALDQYRADQCRITAVVPQSPDIVDTRRRYRCSNQVIAAPPPPSSSPTAAPGPAGSGMSFTAPPRRPVPPPVFEQPTRPPPAGAGAPGPVPRPPAPAPPLPVVPVVPPFPSPGRQCIELLGIGVCLILEL